VRACEIVPSRNEKMIYILIVGGGGKNIDFGLRVLLLQYVYNTHPENF
jgi:hypothetical protein